jgi:hypothetical protein
MYPDGNTDKLFVQLSFEATGSKKPFGLFNWYGMDYYVYVLVCVVVIAHCVVPNANKMPS